MTAEVVDIADSSSSDSSISEIVIGPKNGRNVTLTLPILCLLADPSDSDSDSDSSSDPSAVYPPIVQGKVWKSALLLMELVS